MGKDPWWVTAVAGVAVWIIFFMGFCGLFTLAASFVLGELTLPWSTPIGRLVMVAIALFVTIGVIRVIGED